MNFEKNIFFLNLTYIFIKINHAKKVNTHKPSISFDVMLNFILKLIDNK